MTWRLSRKADLDVLSIYLEGARQFGPAQADRYHNGLEALFDLLAQFPRAAHERDQTEPPVRIHPYRSHVIVYRVLDDDILIIRVRHGREDWAGDPP
jgi:toxin ParE1/3/4